MDIFLKCPAGGEDWPAESYKSTVDIYADPLQYRNIHFTCPAGHSFTLAKAVRDKMFTKDEATRMIEEAKNQIHNYLEKFKYGN